jgi:hypothetical protein
MRIQICVALFLSCLVGSANSQTVYMGPQGQPLGQSYKSGNQTVYMGPQGQPLGSSYNMGCDPEPQAIIVFPQDNSVDNSLRAMRNYDDTQRSYLELQKMREERRRLSTYP